MVIRIRFHGRGGHGVKTASRIVGSAAYRAGFMAQDSPLYGAERRGAPVMAFTRISTDPILERGIIENPDIILIADETLLADPMAGTLSGQSSTSAVFVNADSPGRLAERFEIKPRLFTFDLTTMSVEALGHAHALSVSLAGAAAKLSGIVTQDQLTAAAEEELSGLGFPQVILEKNVELARRAYSALPALIIEEHDMLTPEDLVETKYEDPLRSAPDILNTGNAVLKKTGNWRVEQPVIELERCTRCGLCSILCPDGAIAVGKDNFPVVDYDHCKGCMICREICPPKAIETRKEVKAW